MLNVSEENIEKLTYGAALKGMGIVNFDNENDIKVAEEIKSGEHKVAQQCSIAVNIIGQLFKTAKSYEDEFAACMGAAYAIDQIIRERTQEPQDRDSKFLDINYMLWHGYRDLEPKAKNIHEKVFE